MSFLNIAVVQSCRARVPINVLQVSVSKQFHGIAASIIYEGKNGRKKQGKSLYHPLTYEVGLHNPLTYETVYITP
jgi:hypothetical protein